mmetsp:Transcript_60047/g.172368  ORF Transcript_60047/g.172368 Transcript_60047/m.172368 type:complete len:265 (+) Transcript_60047:625-1419(+)
MHQHKQAPIHLRLEVSQGKIVVVTAEGVLQLDGDDVEGVGGEHRDPRQSRRPNHMLDERGEDNGCDHCVEYQQERNDLHKGKRKLSVGNLFRVQQVHVTSRDGLVDAGENWRWNLDHTGLVRIGDHRLDQVHQDFDLVEAKIFDAILHVRQHVIAEVHDVDGLQNTAQTRDFLQGAAVAEAHESDKRVTELLHGRLLARVLVPSMDGEGDAVTDCVEPFALHLVKQSGALPEPSEGLTCSETHQREQNGSQRTPQNGIFENAIA